MKILHASMLAALLAAWSAVPAQPTQSSVTVATAPGATRTVRTVRTTATVVGIAPETRTVSLKRADGQIVDVQAGDEVKNFDRIKVGDTVTVDYTEALSLELKKGGTGAPSRSESQGVTAAPAGAQPRGSVGRQVTVLANVIAVDSKARTVTLRGPQDHLLVLEVHDPEQLKRIKQGDQVRAVYTEALAVAVEPAPPAAGR